MRFAHRTATAPEAETTPADEPVAITSAGNAAFARYATATVPAVGAPRPRPAPPSSADVGIGRALASAGARRAARAVDTSAAEFNPGSVVHDLRRAIDQEDVTDGWVMGGSGAHPTTRRVDAALVLRVLDGLTPDQIAKVEQLYQAQEKTPLKWDLFGLGQSGAPSNLKPDQRARIEALLKGTAPTTTGAADARLEAVAVELHELLSKSLDEEGTERVMSLFRRPPDQLAAVEAQYQRHYGHPPNEDIVRRITGVQLVRVMCLRAGDVARADALAIDAKRRALEDLQGRAQTGQLDYGELMHFQEKRKKLIDGITAVADANRGEALQDGANAGKPAAEATNQRLAKIMAIPVAGGGKTLADELAFTLKGTAAAGVVKAMTSGTPVQTAAARVVEMEARGTTSSAKLADLIRGLREQADHDVTAGIPQLPMAEKEALLANPTGRKTELVAAAAKRSIDALVTTYDSLRPADGRTWATIVSSADSENEEMLDALTAGAGKLAPVDELRFAIRKKDAARIKAVLRTLRTKEDVDALDQQYRVKFGEGIRGVLLGGLGTAAAENEDMFTNAIVRGRDAAQVSEYLAAPARQDLGTVNEVELITKHGLHEVDVTDANRGSVGSLRQLFDEPETHELLNESAGELRQLQQAWKANAGNPRLQAAILAELKQVRATLSGDATAYEDENAEIRAQIRSAVSLAVQVTLALTLPGVGAGMSGFIATTMVNIGATVASNMVIYGDQYNLSMLYDDVVGGGLGALGGKLGEDVMRLVSKQVAGTVATEAIRVAEAAGKSPKLVAEAGRAAALATEGRLSLKALAEAGNIAGATTASTVATGHDGFTAEGILQNFLMNRLGQLRSAGGAGHGPAGEHAPIETHAAAEPAASHTVPAETPAVGPAHPAEAAHPTEPAHPAEAGGSGGPRPEGPGSAAERLEARASARKLEQLASQWPGMGHPARCAGLADIANDMLVLRGAPSVRVVPGSVGSGNEGAFHFNDWTIHIDPALIGAPSVPPELVASLTALSRHESEHVLQWWTMARLRANQGAGAPQIAAEMGIPIDVAQHAVREVASAGMSRAEQAAGQVWWNSVYDPSSLREPILGNRGTQRTRLERLDAEIKAAQARGEQVDQAKLMERDDLRVQVAGSDLLYQGLPEERPAFERGGVAGREAQLEQLTREADLADIALQHATDDLKQIEDRHLTQVAAGKRSSRRLRETHADAIERVKLLQKRADAARVAREAMEDTITPPDTLRADEPSDTQTAIAQAPAADAEPVIEQSPPGGFEPTTREPLPEAPGPDPEQVEIDLEQIGEVESLPIPEPPERADDPEGTRQSHASVAELRTHLAEALQKVHAQGEAGRQPGAARDIVALVAEIRKTDPTFADRVQQYFDAIEDPAFLEAKMAQLWEQAGHNRRTTADETVHILGNGTPAENHFTNTPNLPPEQHYAEFQEAIRDPRTFVDEAFAGDFHGSHVHAFHEYLGDCLFGPGEGRKFRQKLAELTGPTKTLSTGVEQPFWSQVWDALFDAQQGDGLHFPDALGKILQDHLGYPKRAPKS